MCAEKRVSLADVVLQIISDWQTFLRALAAVAAFGAMLALTVYGTVRFLGSTLGVEPTSITLGAFGSGVVLQARGGPNDPVEYLVMVHPRGWQQTEISVSEGDSVFFAASGSIHISLNSIVQSTQDRHEIEKRYVRTGQVNLENGQVPEDVFSPEENARIALPRPWLGPEGHVTGDTADHRYPGRTARKVMPGRPYGELIGAISTNAEAPGIGEKFPLGRLGTYQAPQSGRLWFAINDVISDDDRFFNDNLGIFLVRVTVRHK